MGPEVDEAAATQLQSAMGTWDQGAWCLAALTLTVDPATDGQGPLLAAARDVLSAAGLWPVLGQPERLPFTARELTGMAAGPLLHTAALATRQTGGWAAQSEAALSAQGNASGSAAAGFIRFALPHLGELAERLATPGARMLDVGTGIGALAIGFAAAFPHLHVTGIDVLARALDIARADVAASPVASRIELRLQDVADLTDQECYDLAWIPAPFVPEPAFTAGVARTVTALRPGGLIMIGHVKFDGGELENAITRFKTVTYGGTALDGPSAAKLLGEHGLHAAQTVATPPGAPGVTIGLR